MRHPPALKSGLYGEHVHNLFFENPKAVSIPDTRCGLGIFYRFRKAADVRTGHTDVCFGDSTENLGKNSLKSLYVTVRIW